MNAELSGGGSHRLPVDIDGWTAFFESHQTIVLVANSDAVEIDALFSAYGDDALYVFFNKVYKVLQTPFRGASLLVARSSAAGANIVYRREVGAVTKLLQGPRFAGVLNLRVGGNEAFSAARDFDGVPSGTLDLTPAFHDFYPSSHVPTSGFALVLWLTETLPQKEIVLAGFTGRRSAKWRLFTDHDWTFEQIVQRLLLRAGRIHSVQTIGKTALTAISERFPEFSQDQVALTAAEVLSERFEGTSEAIDGLVKVTRMQARLDGLLRSLKPKTRKQRLAERKGENGS